MAVNNADREFMAEAIQLAARGMYSTQPNPRVGCVIVNAHEIVGRGWHRLAGEAHAEINALNDAGDSARGGTAYVTLEPCSHTGRTGPCCEALIKAGIKRVVVAMEDPHPLVSGQGIKYLKQHQVEVIVPHMEEQAVQLNIGYVKRQKLKLPFVRCKLAMSLDGRTGLANGESKWITGTAARADVQKLRARSCAIVTGIGTVLADDPAMTIRKDQLDVPDIELAIQKQPLRVVLDSLLRIKADATILNPADRVIVICGEDGDIDKITRDQLYLRGVEVIRLPSDGEMGIDLAAVIRLLGDRECNEILFESGAQLAGALISSGLLDELVIYISAKFLGHRGLPLLKLPEFSTMDQIAELEFRDVRQVGEDLRITAVLK
ncbi:MAG: bifunctional diaminohydroxyphosphoribosylaminopyrimidine deaminase/5-amino-6-(5-phosphoribosylamino)uracil reductase RibD [Gammaproteobacteria bacterium]|nr:bifunctional diaminohydroxyphosphoribosylaminopyrimidine deaminase/5-amino-6-(5-phosphoribosylamino)uracil reductase RibD [Gammaproteobacteria bacterium]